MNVVVDGIIYQLQSHGGVSRLFSEILPRICGIDDSLRITLLTSGQSIGALPTHPHIHHHSTPDVKRFLRPLRPRRLCVPLVSPAQDLVRWLWVGSGQGEIWHTTYYTMPYLLGKRSWTGPIVITVFDMIHERFPEYFADAYRFSKWKKSCVEKADYIIAISECTKRDIVEYLGISENKVTVTHLGVSTSFKEIPESDENIFREHFKVNKPFILYVGHRWGYKNFQTLLKAYSVWNRRNDFDLICVGGATKWREDEFAIIAEAGLKNSVRLFPNARDDELRAFYSCAYAFVYPSLYEGFGIPPLEAMSCGTPVIVSNTSSITEVVGDAGLYFSPSSEEELLGTLDRIVNDVSLYQDLVSKGLKRSKIFNWQETATKTYNFYKDIL